LEDAIWQPDLAKSMQRYQLAVDEAKVRLEFVTCSSVWFMPSRIEINTESIVSYKKAGLRLMEGGDSKVNAPSAIHQTKSTRKQIKLMVWAGIN